MSQHDFDVANASGLTVRQDLNTALLALASLSSGAVDPSLATGSGGVGATVAYQWWIDTSGTPVLKIRNAANSAWITVGTPSLANLGLLPLTGGTLTAALLSTNTDHWKIPAGTTAQRPGAPAAGSVRYNSDLAIFEGYKAAAWSSLGGGSGGGGSLQWTESDNAPTPTVDSVGNRTFSFEQLLAQTLYTSVKVPHSYIAGSPITLYMPFYNQAAAGTVLIQTVTTLIRPGTTLFTATTNQRTSTNAAVTMSGGTTNIPQMVTFDLSSSTGTINSVAVAADDIINIAVSRATDTSPYNAELLAYIAELTFA